MQFRRLRFNKKLIKIQKTRIQTVQSINQKHEFYYHKRILNNRFEHKLLKELKPKILN